MCHSGFLVYTADTFNGFNTKLQLVRFSRQVSTIPNAQSTHGEQSITVFRSLYCGIVIRLPANRDQVASSQTKANCTNFKTCCVCMEQETLLYQPDYWLVNPLDT